MKLPFLISVMKMNRIIERTIRLSDRMDYRLLFSKKEERLIVLQNLHRYIQPEIDIGRIVLRSALFAATMPQTNDDSVVLRDYEDVLPQYTPQVRYLHPFVLQIPELVSVYAVWLLFILRNQIIGRTGGLRQIKRIDQPASLPFPSV